MYAFFTLEYIILHICFITLLQSLQREWLFQMLKSYKRGVKAALIKDKWSGDWLFKKKNFSNC